MKVIIEVSLEISSGEDGYLSIYVTKEGNVSFQGNEPAKLLRCQTLVEPEIQLSSKQTH